MVQSREDKGSVGGKRGRRPADLGKGSIVDVTRLRASVAGTGNDKPHLGASRECMREEKGEGLTGDWKPSKVMEFVMPAERGNRAGMS
ncbi:hypothetical protein E2562_006286 [Oryza meyeriana var. granulata]|uniref:Uncharacterized protein n=1 Tax=Oryza meyeriana var. granulata TaxID=110450 RepID=A0A6G1EFC4_9ORYZ|nr:hypothetical protein E2562_006286 [Oryza meyeriana var. granulata]